MSTEDVEAARARKEAKTLEVLQSVSGLPAEMHASMTDEHRAWWRNRGIPDSMQDFWLLGHTIKSVDVKGVLVHGLSAFSFAKWSLGFQLSGIDFRLEDPPEGVDKYRPLPNTTPSFFVARPDIDSHVNPNGVAVITEGAIKGAVTSISLGNIQVLSVPSANSWSGIVPKVSGAERVIVCLDPDAWGKAAQLAQSIGPKAVFVTLPGKIDDLFLQGALTKESFWKLVRLNSRR